MALLKYAGFDPTERQICKPVTPTRGPGHRFSEYEIAEMQVMASDGCNSLEIGKALGIKAEAIRAKLNVLGVRLRRKVTALRVRMVLNIPKRMRDAAQARHMTVQRLIRLLLDTINRDCLYDSILGPIPESVAAGSATVSAAPVAPLAAVAEAACAREHAAPVSLLYVLAPRLSGVCPLHG